MATEKLYGDLADWWPLLSDPADYEEEAEIYKNVIIENSIRSATTMLELGSGGGNNASFLKKHFSLTLVDISEDMLRVSKRLNPDCEHIQGDMRNIRLGKEFDVVFIHDAISYMSTLEHLGQVLKTAFVHCRSDGVALFVPDYTKESFRSNTSHGGNDKGNRGIRYLSWTMSVDSDDEKYKSFMTYLLKNNNEITFGGLDESVHGLFSEKQWLELIKDVGFEPKRLPYNHSELPEGLHSMFIGRKVIQVEA